MGELGWFQITLKVFLRNGADLLVLMDRKSHCGDLPGGRMNQNEFYENWLDSVQREIEEELGPHIQIQIETNPFLIHKHRVNEGNHPCVIVGYKANYISGEIILSDEHDYLKWVNAKTFDMDSFFSEYMLDAMNLYQRDYA